MKAYKTSEIRTLFPYESFDHPDKVQKTELPTYDAYYSELFSYSPFEAEYNRYVTLLKSGMTTEHVVTKLKLSEPPPTGVEDYQNLQKSWEWERMSSFKHFLRWYN